MRTLYDTDTQDRPANDILGYGVDRKRLLDGGFSCESFSGNVKVMKRFQGDISKLKNVAPSNMRILYNPAKNQYELYIWRGADRGMKTGRPNKEQSRSMTKK